MKAVLSKIVGTDYPMVSNTFITVDDWKEYRLLLDCDIYTVVTVEYFGDILSIFVDDEGLLKPNFGRKVLGYPEPLFGNMLITGGVDDNGDTMDIPESISMFDIQEIVGGIEYETRG